MPIHKRKFTFQPLLGKDSAAPSDNDTLPLRRVKSAGSQSSTATKSIFSSFGFGLLAIGFTLLLLQYHLGKSYYTAAHNEQIKAHSYTSGNTLDDVAQNRSIGHVQQLSDDNIKHIRQSMITTNTDTAVKNAVVHIGPHKTGSTAIQEYSRILSEHLLEDGYDMPWSHKFVNRTQFHGPPNQVNIATCFIKNSEHREKKFFPCRTDLLEAGKSIGHNFNHSILLSAETFDNLVEDEVASLYEYLHPTWDNVTIVAVYRRFYDWLASFHNQVSKDHMTTWLTQDLWYKFQQNSSDHLGRSLLDDFNGIIPLQGEVKGDIDKPFSLEEYILYAIPRYKKYFTNVAIINIHDKSVDSTDSFFCDMMPHAPKTCHAFRQKVAKDGTTRQENKRSKDIVYKELAYAAHRRGIFHIKAKKHLNDTVTAMQHYQEKLLNLSVEDFPRKCLPQEILDEIWDYGVYPNKLSKSLDLSLIKSPKEMEEVDRIRMILLLK
mmetsp:Transcript_12812/g.21090  ORF Transcript_12812/g.21090 Transcript_12812/m.21090 type:complete len:489 (+) Transcript_12812:61-1527(+)